MKRDEANQQLGRVLGCADNLLHVLDEAPNLPARVLEYMTLLRSAIDVYDRLSDEALAEALEQKGSHGEL